MNSNKMASGSNSTEKFDSVSDQVTKSNLTNYTTSSLATNITDLISSTLSTTKLTDLSSTLSSSSSSLSSSSSSSSTSSLITTAPSIFNNTTTAINISDAERQAYLDELQDETTLIYIPSMIYVLTLAIVGLLGNSLVLMVYFKKMPKTPIRIFILTIASFDIVVNVIVIPAEVYDMFHIWDFNQPAICRTRLYFNAFTTLGSGLTLGAVAITRYRKICTPFGWQVSIKNAKIICGSIFTMAALFAVPYAIINGRQTKKTGREGINGYECTIDDSYKETIWPMVNGAFFLFLFFATTIPLVVLYILIGVTAWKHSKVYGVSGGKSGKGMVRAKSSDTDNSGQPSTQMTGKSKDNDSGIDVVAGAEKEEKENTKVTKSVKIVDPAETCSARMIRAPTGEKVQLNLHMVKELTVKLNAVKSERDVEKERKRQRKEAGLDVSSDNDDDDSGDEKRGIENKGFVKETHDVKEQAGGGGETSKKVNEVTDELDKASTKNSNEKKEESTNETADIKLSSENDRQNGTEMAKKGIESNNAEPASTTNVHFVIGTKEGVDTNGSGGADGGSYAGNLMILNANYDDEEQEGGEDGSKTNSEPLSDFAKSMQWVDITYCLNEGEQDDRKSLSKKESLSRKSSRNNSFLIKQRKFRDVLTDTLKRAKKSKREKEGAEEGDRISNGDREGGSSRNSSNKSSIEDEEKDKVRSRKASIFTRNGKKDSKVDSKKTSFVIKTDAKKPNTVTKVEDDEKNQGARRRGIGRTTWMLITISGVYIIGFLPFLIILLFKNMSPETMENLGPIELAVSYLFLRSYFLNCAANPIVYSLCDVNFKNECKAFLKIGGSGVRN